ncbi:MAG TPA: flagellar biosynthesis anti-sigma factor FlgM [Candidatus Sulfotelmatobacter sp.]|nr:flagellar biosynthesis anti-sigma factor FlgM [Candidatus Sulfotelmatobacter sp.]
MRIDFQTSPQPAAEAERNRSPQAQTDHSSPARASGEDQALISGARAQVRALVAQAAQLPEVREQVREEKVQALREAVAGGRYRIDAHKVAEAMLSHIAEAPAG